LLLSLPVGAGDADNVFLGRLLSPDAARITIRQETCRCSRLDGEPEVVLLTLGSERENAAGTQFHPLATFAFDRSLSDEDPGQWVSLWIFGPSAPGWRRQLRAFLPFPSGPT
jgi:hypothetical protein